MKWWIDPGLEGDAYADQPYLYGAALSSWNYLRVCGKVGEEEEPESISAKDVIDAERVDAASEGYRIGDEKGEFVGLHDIVVEEGAELSGENVRLELNIPEDPAQRKKFFLDQGNREKFLFEKGRVYKADFGNPYLGFNGMSYFYLFIYFIPRRLCIPECTCTCVTSNVMEKMFLTSRCRFFPSITRFQFAGSKIHRREEP